ncbi:N-terminal binuclear Zn cluster-containing/DNA binding domain-containing protein [Thelonectria olida]|uniref:N-terminal binuclear Zn cluster-containing/DNA binding domain-containing protein n=1 Tax=Thelonectria olida TaxID=1576542 RepID=A0A9P8WAS1_9HYPO|nr:N-terminal binuclear Zn cluster-containing/DNA binding domain-containing protein [Thelonectria olida]
MNEQPIKRGRKATSCAQCQRRKKKCSRQWPCNHCQSRGLAHQCRYESARRMAVPSADNNSVQEMAESRSTTLEEDTVSTQHAAMAVASLGYINDNVFESITKSQQPASSCRMVDLSGPARQAAQTVPPRPYADILVQNFFESVNHHYCVLHKPNFMVSYVNWWSRRRDMTNSCSASFVALTALVLRICSNSMQFLSAASKSHLESDLGDSATNLGNLYHSAADTLSSLLPAGSGGLLNAQQLFLGATFLKAEAEFLDSWHVLAAAVRQAQEIEIDTDKLLFNMTEFERDSRRRLWCSLITWDKFMSVTFNRPLLVQSESDVPYPSLDLDLSGTSADIPSAIVAKVLENQLARALSKIEPPTATTFADSLAMVEKWMASLPPVFALEDPDMHWDVQCPRLSFQRLQLHCVGYMAQMVILKPLLSSLTTTRDRQRRTTNPSPLLDRTITICLESMAVCKDFFDLGFPQQAKYFMISFCSFDNAALLCSLLLQDPEAKRVPRRGEIVEAIGTALSVSFRLRGHTRMGDSTWSVLSTLVKQLRLSAAERNILDTASMLGTANIGDVGRGGDGEIGVYLGENLASEQNALENEMWQPSGSLIDTDVLLQGTDLGALDGLWDWQNLQLEF